MKDKQILSSQHKAVKIAGISYLLVLLVPMLPMIFIDPKITVEGDIAATVHNIMENQVLFNISNAINLLMFAGVAVLSLALYQILKPIGKELALIGLVWRLIEAVLGCFAVISSMIALQFLNGENYSTIFGEEQLQALAGFFLNIYWTTTIIVFVFLALGSILYFYLFLKSNYIPKILAIWGIASFSLVLIGSFISILFSNDAYMILGAQAILFELVIGFWLVIKGIDVHSKDDQVLHQA